MDLITPGHTIVAHTYTAWLWFPDVIVMVDKAVNSAVLVADWLSYKVFGANGAQKGGLFKQKQKQEDETFCKH